jgi:hypothetical protein
MEDCQEGSIRIRDHQLTKIPLAFRFELVTLDGGAKLKSQQEKDDGSARTGTAKFNGERLLLGCRSPLP